MKTYRKPRGRYWDFPRQKWRKISKVDQALRIARSNKRKIKEVQDVYINDDIRSSIAMNATPVVTEITPAGLTGYKGTMKNIYIKGIISHVDASVLQDAFRVVLIKDTKPQGAVPTPLEVFNSNTPRCGAQKKVGAQTRFKILRSWFGTVNKYSNGSFIIDDKVPLNFVVETKTAGNFAIANMVKNALSIMYWTTASANQPKIEYNMNITNNAE